MLYLLPSSISTATISPSSSHSNGSKHQQLTITKTLFLPSFLPISSFKLKLVHLPAAANGRITRSNPCCSLLEAPVLWAGRLCIFYALLKAGLAGSPSNPIISSGCLISNLFFFFKDFGVIFCANFSWFWCGVRAGGWWWWFGVFQVVWELSGAIRYQDFFCPFSWSGFWSLKLISFWILSRVFWILGINWSDFDYISIEFWCYWLIVSYLDLSFLCIWTEYSPTLYLQSCYSKICWSAFLFELMSCDAWYLYGRDEEKKKKNLFLCLTALLYTEEELCSHCSRLVVMRNLNPNCPFIYDI